jgi:hypothetical protein
MRPSTLLLLLLLMTTAIAASTSETAAGAWTETRFLGARAWQSRQGGQLAIVSEARCRLLYLGAADGSLNLLSAPANPPAADASDPSPNWGGHRFWLGPQQRWVWPPLADWEASPAASASAAGAVLTLTHPRGVSHYPTLTREYAWEGTRLRCTVRWKDDGRAYYGMHVVAVDAPAEISGQLHRCQATPEGAVAVRMDGFDTRGVVSHPAATVAGDTLTLRSGAERPAKMGLSPQPLRCARASGWSLVMSPGPATGVPIGASDQGFLSQVWVGLPRVPFAELEQLSPFVLGDTSGLCSSTCYLEAIAP